MSATSSCSIPPSNGPKTNWSIAMAARSTCTRPSNCPSSRCSPACRAEELTDLASIGTVRNYRAGEKIVAAGDPATSLFFLRSGAVHVTLPDGVRLATLTAGMAFGEMALLEPHRSADVLADGSATAVEVPLKDFERFRKQHPRGRRKHHAQPGKTAGRPADRRQHAGRSAVVELGARHKPLRGTNQYFATTGPPSNL